MANTNGPPAPLPKCAPRGKGAGPEEQACIIPRLYYTWMSGLVEKGRELSMLPADKKRPLLNEDLIELPTDEFADEVYEKCFKGIWEEEIANPADPVKGPSLTTALKKAFGREVALSAFLKIVADACMIGIPLVLQLEVRWLGEYNDDPAAYRDRIWEGYVIALGMMAMFALYSFMFNASMFYTMKAFQKMRTVAMLAIFDKGLRLPGGHPHTGRVAAMHGTDCSKFIETSQFVQHAWSAPLFITGAIVALYFMIGPAAFIGIVVAIITVPLQGVAARTLGMGRAMATKYSDRRLTRINEFVQGIRIIKFMSWERQFEAATKAIRVKELLHILTMHKARAFFQAMLAQAPYVIAFATFACAYAFGNDMKAEDVFPAFAMLNVLRAPLTIMPLAIAKLMELSVSLARINEFLLAPEHESIVADVDEEGAVVKSSEPFGDSDDSGAVAETLAVKAPRATAKHAVPRDAAIYVPRLDIEYETKGEAQPETPGPSAGSKAVAAPPAAGNPSFGSSLEGAGLAQRVRLMGIDEFVVPERKLTIVIGPTAGGKSTLVNALVGEALVSADSAPVYRRGTVAYVPQEAWIMNATLRDNILMGRKYDPVEYKRAILACQLRSDFDQLDGSDQTEIGERGINLSGGQKQRVAFARAVYSGRDIVLMDDPLSAVDPHVCAALFHTCVRTALRKRTRVLVTHQQQFLQFADNVVVVAGREIVFQGSYAELQKSERAMAFVAKADQEAHEQAERDGVSDTDDADSASNLSFQSKESIEIERRAAALHEQAVSDPSAADSQLTKLATKYDVPDPAANSQTTGQSATTKLMQAEKQDLSQIGWPIFSWYSRTGGWGLMVFVWFMYVIWRASSVWADLMLSWWATRTPPAGYTLTEDEYLYWYAIAIVIAGIFVVARFGPFIKAMMRASEVAHDAMITRLLRAPMSFFDTTPTGRIINRVSKDVEMLDVVVPETLSFFYNLLLVLVGAWVVQSLGAWFMPIVFVGILIAFYMLFRGYVVANHGVKRLDAVNRSPVLSTMNEMLGGLPCIRAYSMVDNYREQHLQRLQEMNRSSYGWRNLQRWLMVRVDGLTCVTIGAVAMVSIAVLTNVSDEARRDFYPIATLGITYSVVITGAVGFLVQIAAELIAALSSVERVREYAEELEVEREVRYDGDAGNVAAAAPSEMDPETNLPLAVAPPPAAWPGAGRVEFDNVFLRYRKGLDLVLRGVSFAAEAGEKVGIVGRTGSGKSTIMLSLFRMIETDKTVPGADALDTNRVLLDGVDIAHLKLDDLRTKITIIPQDPLLFEGTIRSNLDPFNEHDEDAIWTVLEKAHVRPRVESEGKGLDCAVNDRGSNFSAGERQLICLARALLKNCRVLLLDEATASIDPHHDRLLQATIRKEFADRTVLTIAHRLGTIIDSDKVLVLDAGVALEFGQPWELLQRTPGSEEGGERGGAFWGMVAALGEQEAERLREAARVKASGVDLSQN